MFKTLCVLCTLTSTLFAQEIVLPDLDLSKSGIDAIVTATGAIIHKYQEKTTSIFLKMKETKPVLHKAVGEKYKDYLVKDAILGKMEYILNINGVYVLIQIDDTIAKDQKTKLPGNSIVFSSSRYVVEKDGKLQSVYGGKSAGWSSERP